MQISDSFKVFLLLSFGLIIGNLLIANGSNTLINIVESDFLLKVQTLIFSNNDNAFSTILLPLWQSAGWYQWLGFSEFNVRLIGIVIFLLSCFGFYFFGKKLFGIKPTSLTLLVLGSCFFPANLIKFASGDAWLLGSHLMSFLFLILFLKQPTNKWKWSYWAFVIVGALVHPLSSLIWNLGLWGYLQIFHPKGKILAQLWLLPLLAVLYLPLYYFDHLDFNLPYFFTGFGSEYSKWFFPIVLLGVLPWFGFLPVSFWDMFNKLRKKEEMAMINLGWILFGIFSQSMVLFVGLAFIMAKQLLAYFQKNYPYARWVKAAALINMIFTFCALIVILMGGYVQFQAIGYRSFINVSAIYWVMSFAGVLGLFLRSNPMVTGGMAMSGILSALVFWSMVNPLLEQQRNLSHQIYKNLSMKSDGSLIQLDDNTVFITDAIDSIPLEKNLQVYLNDKKIIHQKIGNVSEIQNQKGFVFVSQDRIKNLPEQHFLRQLKGIKVEGGTEFFSEKKKYELFYIE